MKKRLFLAVLTVWGLLAAQELWACAVCFGDPKAKTNQGIFSAMYLLFGVIIFVLGGIAATAFSWARRAKCLEKDL